MGLASTPRHRGEGAPSRVLADLRRSAARLLAGRDLYADDQLLRPASARDTTDEPWPAFQPAANATRGTAPA